MSIHKLTAGSGYDYLTRQVAALDATEKGHVGLASYYTERGETPGQWIGTGLNGIDGLTAGDVVTAEQMQALFGSGHHPLAHQRAADLNGPDLTDENIQAATRLGAPYKVYANDVSPFRVEVAKRIAEANQTDGVPHDWPVTADERARIRTDVARQFFQAEHGRDPTDAREIAATIAKHSRPKTTAVAGYDLTFSPVKSVSALWAIAPPDIAARIERAHRAAISDALTFIEQHALYTRTGTNGVRQVDVHGLVATAFTHRDSRAGDPDLHTHVAVANKVQTLDGRWLSIDGRVLFKATVAASETYNTSLERHLHDALGLRFAERPNPDVRKRPVREVIGVHPRLNERWSARRADIEVRRSELATRFQAEHGRPPSPVESLHLAQQSTLDTRDKKHEPRSLSQQRATWRAEAIDVVGDMYRLNDMIAATLRPRHQPTEAIDAQWLQRTANAIVTTLEQRRSTWQTWHVRAEAQRRVRAADVTHNAEALVEQLVDDVLTHRSISLARPSDSVDEPAALRRTDGASVYTVAGSDLHTSAPVLRAEQRLVATAGRTDGRTTRPAAVDFALLESAANGVPLNPGQAALVRGLATSGARLQVAIAPAGSGKTTAMAALTRAWTDDGGTVIGLAPSAAAASVLRDQIATATDTLAKLTHGLATGFMPGWAATIDEATLVIIDEAGMADTLTLDRVVEYVVARGGSVRLVGDDQQLAAIGAGGVLRDIQATHGVLHLTQLMRFTDTAEAAASLALRDGRPEALGFYLDTGRVHVGDLTTLTDDVFQAWSSDRAAGLDAIMLAPTRDLVADLNQRARAHRLGDQAPARTVRLADGNTASVGDVVITRHNNRRLRISATDWVKNGDRWTIRAVRDDNSLTVAHARSGRIVRLPAEYVAAATDLGYATTIHTAQGVSADTMHGLSTGAETRQQLYTMLTRGARANHLYLQVVGDGDPHSVIRPETVHPATATDVLEAVLARDDSPRSATTLQRDAHDPAVRLGEVTARYVDSLYAAAEAHLGPRPTARLEQEADHVVPGVTHYAAWPALRAHLLLLAAAGTDPMQALLHAAELRDLQDADDIAAVLDWRLDDTGHRSTHPGPLPWLPGIPDSLRADPEWGTYLTGRAQLVRELAHTIHTQATAGAMPAWARHTGRHPDPDTAATIAIWRAATATPDSDLRPTGPRQLQKAAATWQHHLDELLNDGATPAMQEWGPLIGHLAPGASGDDFLPVLADRLAAVSRAGLDAGSLLRSAASAGPPPDDHAAAALWWRIHRHLTPVVADAVHSDLGVADPTPTLLARLGDERAAAYQSSRAWPTLVDTVDHAVRRGWTLDSLLTDAVGHPDADECQELVWRIAVLLDPIPDDHTAGPYDDRHLPPPADLDAGAPVLPGGEPAMDCAHPDLHLPDVDLDYVDEDLEIVPTPEYLAVLRALATPPEPTDAEIETMVRRAVEWYDCPVAKERMIAVNEATQAYYAACYRGSWARPYLTERLHRDVTGDPDIQPGYAPAGWDHLVRHLRRRGFTDEEMITTGVASTARTGRTIDRFRDRVVFPIVHEDVILGFVGRRNPQTDGADDAPPKYLNTPDTPLFHKGAQPYVVGAGQLDAGATPVLVEGPMDAIAVTLAGQGEYVGVAPLGTSLTREQARQLGHIGRDPIIATDADEAGRAAAQRAHDLLYEQVLNPRCAELPEDADPAQFLFTYGHHSLAEILLKAVPPTATLQRKEAAIGTSLAAQTVRSAASPGR